MEVSSISKIAVIPLPFPPPAWIPPAHAHGSTAGAEQPAVTADSVTLSPAAQQSLAGTAVRLPDGSAHPGPFTQIIAPPADTPGTVFVNEQLQAFGLAATFGQGAASGAFVVGQSGPEIDDSATKRDAVTGLIDTPVGRRAQQLPNQIGGLTDRPGGDTNVDPTDGAADPLSGVSMADEQIYAGTDSLQLQTGSAGSAITAAAGYESSQAAQAIDGVAPAAADQATATPINPAQSGPADAVDWTQEVQSYFAAYGPPPPVSVATAGPSGAAPVASAPASQAPDASAVVAALAAIWDTTGKVSITEQAAARLTLRDYLLSSETAEPVKAAAGSPSRAQADATANDLASNLAAADESTNQEADRASDTNPNATAGLPNHAAASKTPDGGYHMGHMISVRA